jgi:hypothetical protein
VYCHEFGHALGLPDLYDTSTLGGGAFVGPGNWSLMATGLYGGDSRSAESPTHLGAWAALYLGWASSFRPASDSLLVLPALEGGGPVVEFWTQGEAFYEHFLIENRQRVGFDRSLPAAGLLIYHVNDIILGSGLAANKVNLQSNPGLLVVEADGDYDMFNGRNRGEDRDVFPGPLHKVQLDDFTYPNTHSFSGAATNIGLRQIENVGLDMRFVLQVQPLGWGSAQRWSGVAYAPQVNYGAGDVAAVQSDGTLDVTWVDQRTSPPRVATRRKWMGALWDEEQWLTTGQSRVADPAVAAVGDGGLAVAWSDSRFGAREIYLRTYLDGVWSAEQRVSQGPGDSRYPAVAVDRQRHLLVTWLDVSGDSSRVLAVQFTAGTTPGRPDTLSAPDARALAPTCTVDAQGVAYVAWPDYVLPTRTYTSVLLRKRASPTDAWSATQLLVPSSGFDALGVSLACDSQRRVHVLWQENRPGLTELHYQRRIPNAGGDQLAPADTVIEARGESIQSPRIAADALGGLHTAFGAFESGSMVVRYRRYSPQVGWDFRSTAITRPEDGSVQRPTPLPGPDGGLTLVWNVDAPGGGTYGMERGRSTMGAPVVAVPAATTTVGRLRLGPNPLRAGTVLLVRGAAPGGAGGVEILDVAGRRVGSARLDPGGVARFEGGVTQRWRSGLYFARWQGREGRVASFVVLR